MLFFDWCCLLDLVCSRWFPFAGAAFLAWVGVTSSSARPPLGRCRLSELPLGRWAGAARDVRLQLQLG